MQPSFFSSMTPQNATSFMPPQQDAPDASAFTNGLNPQALTALMAMLQKSGGQSQIPPGATAAPGTQAPGQGGAPQQPGQQQQPGQPPQQGGMAAALARMPPQMLMAIIQRLKTMPGGGMAGAGGMPGGGAAAGMP